MCLILSKPLQHKLAFHKDEQDCYKPDSSEARGVSWAWHRRLHSRLAQSSLDECKHLLPCRKNRGLEMQWPNLACISNWSLQLFPPDLSCSPSSSVSLTVKLVNASEAGEWNSWALGAESTSGFDRQRKSYLNLTNRSNSPIPIHCGATTKSKDFLHAVKETQSSSANFKLQQWTQLHLIYVSYYCMLYHGASLRECTVSCDVGHEICFASLSIRKWGYFPIKLTECTSYLLGGLNSWIATA